MTLRSRDGEKCLRIRRDKSGSGNPRDGENRSTLYVDFSPSYEFGDKWEFENIYDHDQRCGKIHEVAKFLLPLYLKYPSDDDVVISTKKFKGSSFVGYAYNTNMNVFDESLEKELIELEVEQYNDFLAGNVWCYSLNDPKGDESWDISSSKYSDFGYTGEDAVESIINQVGANDWLVDIKEVKKEHEEVLGR